MSDEFRTVKTGLKTKPYKRRRSSAQLVAGHMNQIRLRSLEVQLAVNAFNEPSISDQDQQLLDFLLKDAHRSLRHALEVCERISSNNRRLATGSSK